MIGRVVSTKMKHTATVIVTKTAKHPLYKKTYIQSKKYLVDDELGVSLGDIVDFIKVKPISKNKHWKITKVVGKSIKEIVSEQLQEKGKEIISEVMPEEKESEQVTVDSEQKEEKMEKTKKVEQSSRLLTKKEKK